MILGFFKAVKFIGIFILKLVTLSNKSIEELKVKYADSSKPYFLGFGFIIGMVYLILFR